ncbi:MAG: hypothetical protein NTU73_11870 [Ignavibacteriae bacterium]|nr:hypothetical protein [Ignavibacteriota bacterium]
MKNSLFVLITLILISIVLTSCSKSPSKNLIGKWKADSLAGMPKGLETEIYYEFTKDNIIATGKVHGEPLDKIELPYTFKSEEGNVLVLEVVHPTSGAKGEFKIKMDGSKKMSLKDPDDKSFVFSKIE